MLPSCIIEKEGVGSSAVDPVEMELIWGTAGQFECRFPPIPKPGSYNIKGYATFPFQTWAYIEYTFVSDERARNIARKGLDIHRELEIPEEPRAVYTGGPVMLGMGGTSQPIRVKTEGDELLPPGTRIGITLDSAWRKGRLGKVSSLEIKTPRQYQLVDCDREPRVEFGEVDPNDPTYLTWTFVNPRIDAVQQFASVTCKLSLKDTEEASRIAASDKAVRTFVAVAKYNYRVEDKVSVQVR